MAATQRDVDRWIGEGKKIGAEYLISVCDRFDYDDYPVYVMPDEDLEEKKSKFNTQNMQSINEVITLSKV